MQRAWVLNLDADEELRHPTGYTRSAAMARRMTVFLAQARALARPGDVILEAGTARLQGRFLGQAWCPTPTALEQLHRAGALVPSAPPLAVLRRVNHRAFCAELGQSLEGARFVRTMAELRLQVESHPHAAWLLKRPFGFAARGNRKTFLPPQDVSTQRWIEATFRHDGGLQLEPWVERVLDAAIHGHLEKSGAMRLGRPAVQECDARGAWGRSRAALPTDLTAAELELLEENATTTGRALAAAGYFGPFGIDAYRWRDDEGTLHFNPRSEINARYTMGWHVGMGEWRPDHEPMRGR